MRVSEPLGVFEGSFHFDIPFNLFFSNTANGGAVTHDANKVSALISTTSTTNSSAYIQSRRYIRYAPGRSQLVNITGNFNGGVTGVVKQVGMFSNDNGVFFELSGSTLSVVIRSKVSGTVAETRITQANWNRDKLDGSGKSGVTIDLTKQQLMLIDYTWLGLGHVRFGFQMGSEFVVCHEEVFSNILSTAYSQTGTLPFRANVINNSGSTSASMYITCINVVSEGMDKNNSGVFQTVSNGNTLKSIAATGSKPIIALRKNASYLQLPVIINEVQTICNTADTLLIEFVVNPSTLTGASWVASASGRCEYDISSTAYTGGLIVYSTYIKGTTSALGVSTAVTSAQNAEFFLGSDASSSDVLLVAARSLSGTATTAAVINYMELIV